MKIMHVQIFIIECMQRLCVTIVCVCVYVCVCVPNYNYIVYILNLMQDASVIACKSGINTCTYNIIIYTYLCFEIILKILYINTSSTAHTWKHHCHSSALYKHTTHTHTHTHAHTHACTHTNTHTHTHTHNKPLYTSY